MTKNRFSLFVATFLFAGFLFLALPEKGFSGVTMMNPGCCISEGGCVNFGGDLPVVCIADTIEEDGVCTMEGPGGICTTQVAASPVPTVSEWGLIVMACILGIAGFIVIRRRKVTA
jgi:hypothetical protein